MTSQDPNVLIKRGNNLHEHVCDLSRTSGSNLPKLPPNARFYNRWKRNLQKLVLVSTRHPLTRLILRSLAAVTFEKRRHSKSPHRWMIHPCSMLRYYWNIIMTVVFLYFFVSVPYIISFSRIGRNSNLECWNIVYPTYVIFIIDIILNFTTGFVSSDGHDIFLDVTVVARHYVKGFFLIDLISSVPYPWFYSIFISSSGTYSNSVLLIFEFLPILKFIRISTVRRYIQQINTNFRISQTQHIKIWLVILTLLILHWSSCLSYIFPYIITYLQGKPIEDSDAYYISTKLYNSPNWEIYLIFLHIGVSNLIGSSFMEFESFGTSDMAIRCILLLLGKSYLIYLIVIILQFFESSTKSELKYQQIMLEVKKYVHQKKLPLYLQDKLILYYKHRYWGHFFEENIISRTLSNHLNEEILFHSSSKKLLDIPIFQILPRNVLGDLLNSLKIVIYLKDDVIYKAGTEGNYMYFIANGTVALITFSGKEMCHLYDGDYFGQDSLLYPNQPRQESVIALEVCELLCLSRHNFKRFFVTYLKT